MRRWILLLPWLLLLPSAWAVAQAVHFEPVARNVWAHIGDTGPRSVENQGLNANLGLVATPAGAVLIDSGATEGSARLIHAAVRRVTRQPLRWVINTGTQDHRWFGNGYFRALGLELIAHAGGLADMRQRGGQQLEALRRVLGETMNGAAPLLPTLPTRLVEGPDARLTLGGTVFELRHRGGAHTPGDMMVWLPQTRVLFAGDVVYTDRLLAVLPVSDTRRWLESFGVIESLAPARIVPGHGRLTDLATAQTQTKTYLEALRTHARRAVDGGLDPSAAARSFDGRAWRHLAHAEELMPGNTSRVFLAVERE